MLRPWFGGVGFIIVYSAILVKNYRIWRLYSNARLEILPISNSYLLLRGILPMIIIELIILIVWSCVSPIHTEISNNASLQPNQLQIVCTLNRNSYILLGFFIGFKALLITFGVYLGYRTRNVSDNFNETQAIGLATYLTVVISIIALALCFGTDINPTANAAIPVFSIIVVISTTLVLLFFPKVFAVNMQGNKVEWDVNKIRMKKRTSSKTPTNNLSINWTSTEVTATPTATEANDSLYLKQSKGPENGTSVHEGRRRRREELEPETSDTQSLEM